MPDTSVIDSPLGKLKLIIQNGQLFKVELDSQEPLSLSSTEVAKRVFYQLDAYFNSANHVFKLPLFSQGTSFQNKVWALLNVIPLGEVWTYGEVANKLGSSAQAVGNACRWNPIPIIVPCHRVVSASGLGGFAGQTEGELMIIKRYLLKHEGASIDR